MRAVTLWTMLLVGAALPLAVQAAPSTIADGTPIVVMLPKAMASGGPNVGDKVPLVVRDTVYDPAGQVLVANGAAASGTVTVSRGAKRLFRTGALDFVVDFVTATDGTRLVVRGMQRRAGKTPGGVPLLLQPLLLPKGRDVIFAAGTQFAAYADGGQRLVGLLNPDGPSPLAVTDLMAVCADAKTALYAFTLANPNRQHGLLNAALMATVLDANGEPIGSNASPVPSHPQQVVYALRPGETRTFVKQVSFSGGYAKTDLHVAQPWQIWDETANPERDVPVLYSEWQKERTIIGMVRNDQPTALNNVEIVVTVRKDGAISALGTAYVDSLGARSNHEFSVQLTGPTVIGAPYSISAHGQLPPSPAK